MTKQIDPLNLKEYRTDKSLREHYKRVIEKSPEMSAKQRESDLQLILASDRRIAVVIDQFRIVLLIIIALYTKAYPADSTDPACNVLPHP